MWSYDTFHIIPGAAAIIIIIIIIIIILPWARGKSLAWDITIPDTYTESHLHDTALHADQEPLQTRRLQKKTTKYAGLPRTHLFFPVAIETAGTWNQWAVELVQEIGRRVIEVTEDTRETFFLFQRLSIALGNYGCCHRINTHCSRSLCWWANKNNSNSKSNEWHWGIWRCSRSYSLATFRLAPNN